MKPVNLNAKHQFITAFFGNLDEKVTFLERLYKERREDEARMLCVCYLDGLSNWLHEDSSVPSKNFVDTLSTFSREKLFSLVVPELLLNSLPWKSASMGSEIQIRSALSALPAREAVLPSKLITAVSPAITQDQLTWLNGELWRGSIAMAVYIAVRSQNVHWLGSANGLVFSRTTFQGKSLPRIDFHMLHRALQNIVAHARSLSENTNKWFGID